MGLSDTLFEAEQDLKRNLSFRYGAEITAAVEGIMALMKFVRQQPGLDRPPLCDKCERLALPNRDGCGERIL